MRILIRPIVGVAIALFATAADAGTMRDDRNPLLYTSLATQAKYASVGLINEHGPSNNLIASGVLIAPDVVLTAAHVVDHASTIKFTIGGVQYEGSHWVANPNWTGDLSAGYDLGIVQLTASVANITPAVRYNGSSELGSVGTFVGYGMKGTGLTGATQYDTLKRAGMNILDSVYGANERILMSDFDNPHSMADSTYGSPTPLSLEFLIGSGDSGGGMFIDTPQGTRLAGIHTFGTAPDGVNNADYGDTSGAIRLSLFNDWIDQVLAEFSLAGGGPTSAGGPPLEGLSLAVPEPASYLLALVGFAILAMWRVVTARPSRRI